MLKNLRTEKALYETAHIASALLTQVKAMQSGMASLMNMLVKVLPVCDSPRIGFVATDSANLGLISPGAISRRGRQPQSQYGGGIKRNSCDIFVNLKVILSQGVPCEASFFIFV